AMAGDDLYVVRDFRKDLFITGDHALNAPAAIDINKRKHSAVEKIIAHVDYVGLGEEDHTIAVSMAVRKMNGPNVFTIQVDRDCVFKGDDGQRRLVGGLGFSEACLATGDQSLAHVLLGHDWGFLAEVRIAAGVVAMPV